MGRIGAWLGQTVRGLGHARKREGPFFLFILTVRTEKARFVKSFFFSEGEEQYAFHMLKVFT